jgi:DNA-binding NarL/FixJ family response regulator
MIYLLLAFQLVGFIILAYLMVHMYVSLRRGSAGGTASVDARDRQEISEMMSELRRTADHIGQDLAARSAVLQRQIEEAQRRGAKLADLVAQSAEPPAPARTEMEARSPQGPTSPVAADLPTRSEPFRPIDLKDAERYQQVFKLAEQGLSSLEIARQTRVGREEVELLLGLKDEGRNA